jgi:hypothetical protein
MASQIRPDIDPPEEKSDAGFFSLSAEPVVANAAGETISPEAAAAGLPSTYGSQALYLMPRDPHSLFAYWDIDWAAAFGDEPPRDRKVHLRVATAGGVEETSLEVEPMAGSCYVDVAAGGVTYVGEIGYHEPAGVWHAVAASLPVTTPPDSVAADAEVDFATVPFHLRFQRVIDLFGVAKHDHESLTQMLNRVRDSVVAPARSSEFTFEQQEVVRALDQALATSPPPSAAPAGINDKHAQQHLESILGMGNPGTSPARPFGGSSSAFGR